jgi:hypothetical protein
VNHTYAVEKFGESGPYGGFIVPTCTCGWRGRPEYAYASRQHMNAREQHVAHMLAVALSGPFCDDGGFVQ